MGHPPAAPAPFPVPAAGSHAAATASVRWVNPDPTAAAEDAAALGSLGSAASPGKAWGQGRGGVAKGCQISHVQNPCRGGFWTGSILCKFVTAWQAAQSSSLHKLLMGLAENWYLRLIIIFPTIEEFPWPFWGTPNFWTTDVLQTIPIIPISFSRPLESSQPIHTKGTPWRTTARVAASHKELLRE